MSTEVKITTKDLGTERELVGDVAKITFKNDNLFVEEAEDAGIDKATLKKVADFANSYAATIVEHSVSKAKSEFNKYKGTKEAHIIAPFGVNKNDKITTVVIREAVSRNPRTGEETKSPRIKVVTKSKYHSVSKSFIKGLKDDLAESLK